MKKIMGIIFILYTLVSYGFYMIPVGFEKRIDNGEGYMEYYFPNTSLTENIRYKFTAEPGSPVRGDMSPWVELYPKILTVKPGERGILKVFVKSPPGTPEGEYGFHLLAMPMTVPTVGKEGKEISASAGVRIAASIELVGFVGDMKSEISIKEKRVFQENGITKLELTLENKNDKRSVSCESDIKMKNGMSLRKTLGRVYPGKNKKLVLTLDGVKPSDLSEIIIYEDISYKVIHKERL